MSVDLPELLNLADRFLGERVSEGKGDKIALIAGDRRVTYAEVKAAANRFANVLGELGVDPEQRVLIGLPDLPEFVFSLFGTLANGSAVVMVNTLLKEEEIAYFYQYTRAKVAVVHRDQAETFARAAAGARDLKTILVVGGAPPGLAKTASFEDSMARAAATTC